MKHGFIKYKTTLWSLFLLFFMGIGMVSCTKDRNQYYNFQNKKSEYVGSTLNYLNSQGGNFDSMLLVMHRIRWVEDSLNKNIYTVFALPNQCFSTVLNNLNSLRISENKSPLYLSTVDSSQLDTLISRYIIPGLYPTDSITFIDGRLLPSLKYGYNMQLQPIQVNASGMVDGGPSKLYFSDPKNSRYHRDWVRTTTQSVNIETEDGVIHVVSGNHNFGFQEFVERMNH